MTITGLPASTDLNHHWIRWCDSVGFDPNDARPLVCYGTSSYFLPSTTHVCCFYIFVVESALAGIISAFVTTSLVGRLSPEKGARLIARTLRNVLASDGVRVLIAGSGPSEAEVRETVPQIEGRSVITKLSIFEVRNLTHAPYYFFHPF